MDLICYVSAFLDINRNEWKDFNRNIEKYFEYFSPFINMFLEKGEMIVFMDTKHLKKFENMISNTKIKCIPIDEDFMVKNIHVWKFLEKETEIMNSLEYKKFLHTKMSFPENTKPKYTLINHAKIDFVNCASFLTNAEYLCWVDFGYFQKKSNIPQNFIDLNKLKRDKINYQLLNPLTETDGDIYYTLKNSPERIGGFFFFGNKRNLEIYQKMYHKMLEKFRNLGLADDDQHIALRCYFENPSLFHLHLNYEWHKALIMFQK